MGMGEGVVRPPGAEKTHKKNKEKGVTMIHANFYICLTGAGGRGWPY